MRECHSSHLLQDVRVARASDLGMLKLARLVQHPAPDRDAVPERRGQVDMSYRSKSTNEIEPDRDRNS